MKKTTLNTLIAPLWLLALSSSTAHAVDCSALSNWTSQNIYNTGDVIQHSNRGYQSNYWSQGQNPIQFSGPWQHWQELGVCDGGVGNANLTPSAQINGPYSATVNAPISFSSLGSTDSDGTIDSYSWSFGDGSTSTNANPMHAYSISGTYTATLTVVDNEGASDTESTAVTIAGDSNGSSCDGLASYIAGSSYHVGERVVNRVIGAQSDTEYSCKIAGWCSSAAGWAYEPGNGAHWQSAWNEISSCDTNTGSNIAPSANLNGPYNGSINSPTTFSSAGSIDSDGNIIAHSWSFGDGNTSSQANPSHQYLSTGTYTVTLTVTDNEGASATSSTTATISDGNTNPGSPLASRILVGYWHNFINQAGYLPISNVSSDWDIVNLSFAENKPGGAPGEVAFEPAEETEAAFLSGVQLLQSRGQKVLISLGGANAHITLNNTTERDNFIRTMGDIIARFNLDGMDIDLEGGSLNMTAGDTVASPQTPAIVNLIEATKQIKARFGSDFILTMAPETAYVQGGYQTFGGIWGAYLPLIHALRNDLTVLHVQHYNTGSILAADNGIYQAGSADFHVALSDMMITGFAAGQNPNNFFPGLRADQVAIGLPATAGAASSGQTTTANVHASLNCLIKLQQCGSYTPAAPRTSFRGLMTWSINWDVFESGVFSTPHRIYLDANQ